MDTSERSMRMRIASYQSWANTADRAARTAPARKRSHHDRFVEQARELHPGASETQIAQAAEALKKAHYTEMSRRSAIARRIKKDEEQAAKAARVAELLAEAQASKNAA